MNIFALRAEDKAALGDLVQNLFQPVQDRLFVALMDQPHLGQHSGVRHRAGDVVVVERAVKPNGQ